MTLQKLVYGILVTAVLAAIPAGLPAAGQHALLIGIEEYGDSPLLPSLKGSLNDLCIVKEVLQARFGLQDEDFIILADSKATHTGIEQAFRTLSEQVQPGDFVYIHYSGHGSQTDDLNGDERDGKDETWVSYNARRIGGKEADNYDVLDDEIDAWLAALYAKTSDVVFVSDSCHSATVSRGAAAISRAVPHDERPHPFGTRSYAQPARHPGVRIGAARDQESAIEFPTKADQYYGLFTWYWARALQRARKGATWDEVFKRAAAQVTARRGKVQHPQLWGERGLQITTEGFTPAAPTIAVTHVKDDAVTIGAGYLAGVTAGSVYRLHDSDVHNPPTLRITTIKTFESLGKADGAFTTGDLVIETQHVYNFPPLQVYVDADFPAGADKGLLQAIRNIFQTTSDAASALPAYTLTDSPQEADLHLYLVRPQCEHTRCIPESEHDPLPKSFPGQPPEVWILTPEHRLVSENLRIRFDEPDPAHGIRIVRENLTKYARIRELKALGASWGSNLQIAVEAYLLTPAASCQEGPNCRFLSDELGFYRMTGPLSLPEIEKRTFPPGEILTFTLHNPSDRDYYYYLINIAPDGTVEAIFPYPGAEPDYALVKAGTHRELINEVGLMTELPGEETIKFIASRRPFDVSLLEVQGFERRGGTRGAYTPLEHLLISAMHGRRGRVCLRNDDWAVQQLSFEVEGAGH